MADRRLYLRAPPLGSRPRSTATHYATRNTGSARPQGNRLLSPIELPVERTERDRRVVPAEPEGIGNGEIDRSLLHRVENSGCPSSLIIGCRSNNRPPPCEYTTNKYFSFLINLDKYSRPL